MVTFSYFFFLNLNFLGVKTKTLFCFCTHEAYQFEKAQLQDLRGWCTRDMKYSAQWALFLYYISPSNLITVPFQTDVLAGFSQIFIWLFFFFLRLLQKRTNQNKVSFLIFSSAVIISFSLLIKVLSMCPYPSPLSHLPITHALTLLVSLFIG